MDTELNCDILEAYIGLCRAENKDEGVKFLSTYFWPQVSIPDQKGYNGATRMLLAELVSPFLFPSLHRSNSIIKTGQKAKPGCYDAAASSIMQTLKTKTLKFLYIPINENKVHWLLLRMNFTDRRWEFFNSMGKSDDVGIINVRFSSHRVRD